MPEGNNESELSSLRNELTNEINELAGGNPDLEWKIRNGILGVQGERYGITSNTPENIAFFKSAIAEVKRIARLAQDEQIKPDEEAKGQEETPGDIQALRDEIMKYCQGDEAALQGAKDLYAQTRIQLIQQALNFMYGNDSKYHREGRRLLNDKWAMKRNILATVANDFREKQLPSITRDDIKQGVDKSRLTSGEVSKSFEQTRTAKQRNEVKQPDDVIGG